MTTQGEYSVCQFFASGGYEFARRFVGASEAFEVAMQLARSVGGQVGTTVRVIITDSGDHTVFEWVRGEGVVFPTRFEP